MMVETSDHSVNTWDSLYKKGFEGNVIRFVIVSILHIAFNQDSSGQSFSQVATSITARSTAQASWVDINNDGSYDLLIAGSDQGGQSALEWYENNGNNTFTLHVIAQLSQVAFDLADYDHDGYIDLLVAGKTTADEKVLRVYRNNNGSSFSQQSFELEGVTNGDLQWVDLNHDRSYEIISLGLDGAGNAGVRIYELLENQYQPVSHTLPDLSYGELLSFDANNDGTLELLLTGFDEFGNPSSLIYSFDSGLQATLFDDNLDAYAQNTIGSMDLNEDGFADLIISGVTAGLKKATNVYFNNQGNGFTRAATAPDSLSNSALTSGDFNNDGLTDLMLMGLNNKGEETALYYVNSGFSGGYFLQETTANLTPLYNGALAQADFNDDGSLDVFQVGRNQISSEAVLLSSDMHLISANQPPTAPSNLVSETTDNQVALIWDNTADDLTKASSLSYNVYLSREADGTDLVLSPMSYISTGHRRIYQTGNAGYANQMTVRQLLEGRYYWSVQAIDNAYQGSAFAAEQEFVICDPFSLGEDMAICFEETITLSVGETGDVVNWYSVKNGVTLAKDQLTYDHVVIEKDTLVAELTRDGLGCVLYDTIVIDVLGPIDLDLGTPVMVCPGDLVEFEVAGFDQVNWYSTINGLISEENEQLKVPITSRDTIVVEVFHSGTCVQYDSVIVDIYDPQPADLGKDTIVCSGAPLSFDLEDFVTVNWYKVSAGLVASDIPAFDFKATESVQLVAEGIDVNGCSNFDTLAISVLPLPEIDLARDSSICLGNALSLEVAGFPTVNWQASAFGEILNQSSIDFTFLVDDTLVVEVIGDNGCSNGDSLFLTVNPLPVVDLGPDLEICAGETNLLELRDSDFEQVDWSSYSGELRLENSWFYVFEEETTDTLIAKVRDVSGCENADTLTITVKLLPVFDLQDTSVCEGDRLALSLSEELDRVDWLTNENLLLEEDQHTYEFTVTESITVWAEVTEDGCTDTDSSSVTTNLLPTIDLPSSLPSCLGDSVELDGGDEGVAFSWTDTERRVVSADQFFKLEAIKIDRYFLQVISGEGCTSQDSIDIQVNPLPDFSILGETVVCEQEMVDLQLSSQNFSEVFWFDWHGQTLATGTSQLIFEALEDKVIIARVEDANGCVALDSVALVVNSSPPADAGPDHYLCFGEEVALGSESSEDESLSFAWSRDEFLSAPDVAAPMAKPIGSGWFVLTVTDPDHCTAIDSVFVEVEPPVIADAGTDQILCEGEEIVIGPETDKSSYQYQWAPAVGLSSAVVANPTVQIVSDQAYVLTVMSGDCGPGHDTVMVSVRPAPEVDIISNQGIGPGETVQLLASGGTYYRWQPADLLSNPSASDPLATPVESTLFTVEVESEFGCSALDSVMVYIQNALFIPNLFTPNGDGSNDEFKVYGSGISEIQLSIYDLNGRLIHVMSDPEEATAVGWDGTVGGRLVASGTYLWTLEGQFADGSKLHYEGSDRGIIQLLR